MSKDFDLWENVRFYTSKSVKPISEEPVPYVEPETGELKKGLVAKRASYDSTPFIKLFKGTTVLRAALPSSANRVLDLVLYQIEDTKDASKITLTTHALEDFVKAVQKHNPKFKMSRSTMTRGINELIEHNFIIKLRMNEYQINPNLFFNGDRVKAAAKEKKKWR